MAAKKKSVIKPLKVEFRNSVKDPEAPEIKDGKPKGKKK